MFYFGDFTFILLVPALILAVYAQSKVQSTFAKYSKILASSRLTGAQVARELLNSGGLHDVAVEVSSGTLSDHYDPRSRVLRLSPDVYQSNSLAALGVAAHETGHAFQHATGYVPLNIRNNIYPVAAIGSQAAIPLFIMGLIFSFGPLMNLGILVFTVAVFFQVLTLPVEFNASSRAIKLLTDGGYVDNEEAGGAKKVLDAAALTYLAAATMAILQLVRLLILRNSRDD